MSNNDLKTDITTLTQDILTEQKSHPDATGDLSILLTAISSACKWISNVVRKAELLKVIGMTGSTNVQNENVQKLDILSNEIMIHLLKSTGKTALLVSEENEEMILVDDKQKGHYAVVFDPLDGSSNIDCGVSIGTIFGIYRVVSFFGSRDRRTSRIPGKVMSCGLAVTFLWLVTACMDHLQ
jgi:fructose-1,6-bisphosphatase I